MQATTSAEGAALGKKLATRINRVAHRFGVELRKYTPPDEQPFDNWMYYAALLQTAWQRQLVYGRDELETGFVGYCVAHHTRSKSQIFQDLLVLYLLGDKRDGFFVEFGATNGVSLSNSCLLEREFGWRGILAEPARVWHGALHRNRRCAIDTRCVWSCSGERLAFNETHESELSTIDAFTLRDNHARHRSGTRYWVDTVSLDDLLRQHQAPRAIDYLSIDTEGSEFAILECFDFAAYDIGIVTVEHNYAAPDRENIAQLMRAKGFSRLFGDYSLFDDWYVNTRLMPTGSR